MKKIFLAASGVFGAIPGLVIIQTGLGTPPGYNLLFGGVVEAFGALTIIILWVNRRKLEKFNYRKATKYALIFTLLCFVFLAVYIALFNHSVINNKARGTAYYPLWTSGEIAEMVTAAGGRNAAIDEYGIMEVREAIFKMPSLVLTLTTVLHLIFYQAVFTSLALAFGVLGFQKDLVLK